ncbi:MAG: hypothetical protein HOV96_40920 [Nonomuraea sp.]|nr:hypothetical protein [Nonomuraea sp.]NUP65460.1 hypothetical protein [Nonomuraea sp.]NUP83909.1 hypothetical protein [Nonomuraea sp.]NUS08557.1 hypothetical protein [Nonomuraea sp.]NUT39048.1 hypothetical protein [Thermoactinospora sp.]
MTIRRGVLAAALAAGVLMLGSAPARAIPPPPPGGDTLVVFSYYSGDQVVGQRWFGCGQPAGEWGTLSGTLKVFFTPC